MGQDASISAESSASNHSYFGDIRDLGKIDDTNIEGTIRELQLEKLYRKQPHLRPKPQEAQIDPPRLQSLISVNIEEAYVKKIENVYLLIFSMKTQCSGLLIVAGNGVFNSRTFPVSDKVTISLPIPPQSLDDFTLEITPKIEKETKKLHNYLFITKHVYSFRRDVESYNCYEQKLYAGENIFTIKLNKPFRVIEDLISTNDCLFCLTEPATISPSSCKTHQHKIICKTCSEQFSAKINYCPFCITN